MIFCMWFSRVSNPYRTNLYSNMPFLFFANVCFYVHKHSVLFHCSRLRWCWWMLMFDHRVGSAIAYVSVVHAWGHRSSGWSTDQPDVVMMPSPLPIAMTMRYWKKDLPLNFDRCAKELRANPIGPWEHRNLVLQWVDGQWACLDVLSDSLSPPATQ